MSEDGKASRHHPPPMCFEHTPRPMLWLDLETTGIDPQHSVVLEIGAMLSTGSLEPVIGSAVHRVIATPKRLLQRMNAHAHRMHTTPRESAGGATLRDLCQTSPFSLRDAEDAVLAMLDRFVSKSRVQIPLAGSTISMDRAFVRVHMPRLNERLSHQVVDVTSFLIVARNFFGTGPVNESKPRPSVTHCAMDDCVSSFVLMRWAAHCMVVPFMVAPSRGFVPRRIGPIGPVEAYIGEPGTDPHALYGE